MRPGLWVRPLLHDRGVLPEHWTIGAPRVAAAHEVVLDPSLPEVVAQTEELMRMLTGPWGYRLIKHDFTTYDSLGRWGFEMGDGMTAKGWGFRDDARTTAEILLGLYRAIRRGAGDALVLGCNTVGHLSAGLFELSRTGDDTSGMEWERTAKMGPNTLAMRMPQHRAFHVADADCVGLTAAIPWALNRAWLDVLARSGTALFVSADPAALGPAQREALRAAYATASVARAASAASDWRSTTRPRRWRHADGDAAYAWHEEAPAAAAAR